MIEIVNTLNWEKHPLIPVIVQNKQDSNILMLAYTNKEAFSLSLKSGEAHYFSRSKQRIWRKGEESGNIQSIQEIYIDCDGDSILFIVEQKGVACHTGHYSCFFRKIDISSIESTKELIRKPSYHTLDELYHTLQDKKRANANESYTASLYQKGENAIGKKIVEEAAELSFAIKDKSDDEIIYECADLLYHAFVGLSYCDISPDRVMCELKRRFGTSGLVEKQHRK